MLWEGSVLDANEGIRFHGRTIAECQKLLPKGTSGTEMLPEAMFWLLLTGQIPSTSQVRGLSRELAEKSGLPKFVEDMLNSFPTDLHPMTQFACAVSTLNYGSVFAKAYEKGVNKTQYWEPIFDDSISLLAKLPTIAAKIYQNSYKGGGALPAEVDLDQDWAYNFAAMLGKGGSSNENFQDLLRLYLALHGDHEGGNVSAHATHLVGSALSDPFLSYSAGLQGLAGPLHGLAAQEVLRWILKMQSHIGTSFSDQDVKDYLWSTLNSGQVIPGYGHAVLRKPDPRFEALMDFASSRPEIAKDPLFQLVKKNSEIAPAVLMEHGKVSLSQTSQQLPSYLHFTSPAATLTPPYSSYPLPVHYNLPPKPLPLTNTFPFHKTDQKPPPKRRLLLRRPLPPLRLPRNPLLHRHLRRVARPGPARAAGLGPRVGPPHRAPEEHQS